jgi:hypothetical protein
MLDLFAQSLQRTVVRHLVRRDGIAAAHVVGIDAELDRDRIDQPLAYERGLVAAGGAVGGRRGLVGQAKVTDGAIGRDPIRAPAGFRRSCARHARHGCGHRRPGHESSDRRWPRMRPSLIDRGADTVELLA